MPLLHLYHYVRHNDSYCVVKASETVKSLAFPAIGHLRVGSLAGRIRCDSGNGTDGAIVTTAANETVTTTQRYPLADWLEVLDSVHDNERFSFVAVKNDPGLKATHYIYETQLVKNMSLSEFLGGNTSGNWVQYERNEGNL